MTRGWLHGIAAVALALGLVASAFTQPSPPALPARFTPDFFGLNLSRPDAAAPWPDIPFGAWRLWDAQVAWPQLEPEKGRWDFTLLDRLVDEAQRHQVRLMLVLAQSPPWASARPGEASAYRPGYAAEPARLADWTDYVRSVATRYRGRIAEYQVWNEPSDRSHYTGTVEQLVELTCSARQVIRQVDPAARLVSAGSAGPGRHVQYLDDFLSRGGAGCIDVVSHHFYVPRLAPEAMVPIVREVRRVMAKNRVAHLPLWSTEVGWWLAHEDATPDHAMVARGGWRKLALGDETFAHLTRAHLLARAEGVERLYWYAWRNVYGWGLAERASGLAKPGVDRWGRLAQALQGGTLRSCGVEAGVRRCQVEQPGQGLEIGWQDVDAAPREGPGALPYPAAAVPRVERLPR
ncbi:GH39 family glycosyl hydrolase [Leptothrix sp. BB-4]